MKLNVYCFFNNFGGFFGKPFLEVIEPDKYVEQFKQSLFGASVEVLESLKEDDLYFLGTFDNVTGELESNKEFLIHLSEHVGTLLSKKCAPVLGDTNGTEKD